MLSRKAKSTFLMLAGPARWANTIGYRHFRTLKDALSLNRVYLGPGSDRYLEDWINVDTNAFTGRCDVWADLRNPLPFKDNSIDAFYSNPVVEHLPNLTSHFKEVFRRLKPGGWYRVGGPNGDSAIKDFIENDHSWFGDFPGSRTSIGGRFENFVSCRQEHLTILTRSFPYELQENAGLIIQGECVPTKDSNAPSLFGDCLAIENETDFDYPRAITVEATKPEQMLR